MLSRELCESVWGTGKESWLELRPTMVLWHRTLAGGSEGQRQDNSRETPEGRLTDGYMLNSGWRVQSLYSL